MYSLLLGGSRKAVFLRALGMITMIAIADWRIQGNIPLGFLYLFPMVLVGSSLTRTHTAATALLCSLLTEAFDSYEWVPETGVPRDILVFSAFFGMGLFVYEVVRNRKLEMQHLSQIEQEIDARRAAEEQLQVLIESSPAAVFTTNAEGEVLLANEAAHRLFGVAPDTLLGGSIRSFLPALVNVPEVREGAQLFRTAMQCRGVRSDGEVFQAEVWFSTYRTNAGPRLAAMVVDSSEDLRDREELSLAQLMAGSRILVGAVSHEIRNVCGAIAVVHQNLAREGLLRGNKDFETLGTLVLALENIAALDLRQGEMRQNAAAATQVNLTGLLEELRIVIEPGMQDDGIDVEWRVEPELPPVWAEPHSLLQVFLNLTKNSQRAMQGDEAGVLSIAAYRAGERVQVRVQDTGGGVRHPEKLFRPFQPGAENTGLGLYLSRGFMRSFRGDLRYEPVPGGASFIVELSCP